MTELKDQLSLLGRKTEYKQDYAPEVLEAFDNKHPENDYWVRFNCPECCKKIIKQNLIRHYRTAGFCGNTYQLHSRYKNGRKQELETLSFQFP